MDKNSIYLGQIVRYGNDNGTNCVVVNIDKQKELVDLYYVNDVIKNVSISQLQFVSDMKSYNKKIQHAQCEANRLSKKSNDDFIFNDGSKIWFTSDTHFGHDNIIRFCNRPFENTNEMDEKLIENWNSVVKEDDIVFHLGDFAWGGSDEWKKVISQLNGHIHLILGNHDVKNIKQGYLIAFESVAFQRQIEVEGRKIYLNHYPFLTWGGIYREKDQQVWQLFGHVHSKQGVKGADDNRLNYLLPIQMDVGVDANDYRPISWKEVKDKIESGVL